MATGFVEAFLYENIKTAANNTWFTAVNQVDEKQRNPYVVIDREGAESIGTMLASKTATWVYNYQITIYSLTVMERAEIERKIRISLDNKRGNFTLSDGSIIKVRSCLMKNSLDDVETRTDPISFIRYLDFAIMVDEPIA